MNNEGPSVIQVTRRVSALVSVNLSLSRRSWVVIKALEKS